MYHHVFRKILQSSTIHFQFTQWSNIFIKIIISKYVSIQISTLRISQGGRIKLHLQPVSGANNNFLRPLELITENKVLLRTHWCVSVTSRCGADADRPRSISLMLTFSPLLFNQRTFSPKALPTVLIPNYKLRKLRIR